MTTINVPNDYSTISAAITAAADGDTITVNKGTYLEQITIDKQLTLLGAQHDVDARTRPFVAGNESIITFATPGYGSGIVNLRAQGIIFNGFTVQGTGVIVDSTGAIFAGDAGSFLPATTSINVTGLRILNNIIQNNANGILIASIETTSANPNYLVQYNFFQNNSGDTNSGDGQGVYFNNSAGLPMTNVTVTQNLFNGQETSASVNFANVTTSTVTNNVMNQDNSIALVSCTNITVSGNVTSGATGNIGIITNNPADAIFIGFGCTNITVTENLIYTATNNGIIIYNNNSGISIINNCIVGNTAAGIEIVGSTTTNARMANKIAAIKSLATRMGINVATTTINSDITINTNNIRNNGTGLLVDPSSYTATPLSLDATLNYWNSISGPNYNGGGPGTGDTITDNNTLGVQTVNYAPFLTSAITCPSPIILSKTSNSINVAPGSQITYYVTFTVMPNTVSFVLTSFTDPLPALTSGSPWVIQSQTTPNVFTLIGSTGAQSLTLIGTLPETIAPGIYSVTLAADTNISDANETLNNTTTMQIQIGGTTGLPQTITSSAFASIACFHGKSQILTKNILTGEIKHINVEFVLSDIHQVYSVTDQKFIPIIYNIVSGLGQHFMLIKKDSLDIKKPFDDFYITSGHPIVIDNVEIMAQNIPQATQIIFDYVPVYTICTAKREPISINGLDVLTWCKEDWLKFANKYKLHWYDNKLVSKAAQI